MRTSLLSLVGTLLLAGSAVVSAVPSVPVTLSRFQATYAENITVILGGIASMQITSSGNIAYDAMSQRTLTNPTMASLTTPQQSFANQPVNWFDLVDAGANVMVSWGGTTDVCQCKTPEDKDKWQPFFVPTTAQYVGMEEITTASGSTITTDHWKDTLAAGVGADSVSAGMSTQADFWVDTSVNPPVLVRMVNNVGIEMGPATLPGMPPMVTAGTEFRIDFSSVTALPTNDTKVSAIFKSACPACTAAPSNIATVYTAPATCPSSCLCASDYASGLTFFKDVVTYPITNLLAPGSVDATTQALYSNMLASWNLMGLEHTAECDTALRTFMAHFYFKQCSAGGIVAYPAWDNAVWTDKCGATVASSLKSSSFAAVYGSAATGTGSKSAATTGAQASLLLGAVLAAAARFMA